MPKRSLKYPLAAYARSSALQGSLNRDHKLGMNWAKTLSTVSFLVCISTTAGAEPRQDLKSFLLGEKATWDSTGHSKAEGVRLKISYPRSWGAKEGNRPHILQKFASDAGKGMEIVMVQVRPLPAPYNRALSEEEKKEAISRDVVSELAPGESLLSYETTRIDGEPCAMIETEKTTERAGFTIGQKMLTFFVPLNGAILSLQFAVGGDAKNGFQQIRQRYEETKPLFLLVASSCILTDKWKKTEE